MSKMFDEKTFKYVSMMMKKSLMNIMKLILSESPPYAPTPHDLVITANNFRTMVVLSVDADEAVLQYSDDRTGKTFRLPLNILYTYYDVVSESSKRAMALQHRMLINALWN